MLDEKLLDYIKINLDNGIEKNIIYKALIDAGWEVGIVKKAFEQFESSVLNSEAGFAAVGNLSEEKKVIQKQKPKAYKKFLLAFIIVSLLFGGFYLFSLYGSDEAKEKLSVYLEDDSEELSFGEKMAQQMTEETLKMIDEDQESMMIYGDSFSQEDILKEIKECNYLKDVDVCSKEIMNRLENKTLKFSDELGFALDLNIVDIKDDDDVTLVDLKILTSQGEEFFCTSEFDMTYGFILSLASDIKPINTILVKSYFNAVGKDRNFSCKDEDNVVDYILDSFSIATKFLESDIKDYDGIICDETSCFVKAAKECNESRFTYRYLQESDLKAIDQEINIYKEAEYCVITGERVKGSALFGKEEDENFECIYELEQMGRIIQNVLYGGDVKFTHIQTEAISCK